MDAIAMAREVRRLGQRGDTVLAHISPEEAAELAARYGGDVNPDTGLPQFGFFSKIWKGFKSPNKSVLGNLIYGNDITGLVGASGTAFGGNDKILGSLTSGKLFGGGKSGGDKAYGDLSKIAAPLTASAQQQLAQYSSGELKPGDQIQLAHQVDAQKAGLSSLYGSAGLGQSSMLQNQLGNVDANAITTRQGIVSSYLNDALATYGTALGPLSEAIKYRYMADAQKQQATADILGGILSNEEIMGGVMSMFAFA